MLIFFTIALCPVPNNISNGTVTFSGNSVGDNATYTCDTEFELIGDAETICTQATDMNSASFVPAEPICLRKHSNLFYCMLCKLICVLL